MKCPKCNNTLDNDSIFCDSCGTPFAIPRPASLIESKDTNEQALSNIQITENTTPHPWLRYFARWIDYFLFGIFFVILFSFLLLYFPILNSLYQSIINNSLFLSLFIIFLWVFIEPIFLFLFGTTPGKYLFNIRIRDIKGRKLDYSQGLRRSFSVYLRGMGLGIPLVNLITMIAAHSKLTKYGTTTWDQEIGSFVIHRPIGIFRFLGMFLIFVGFVSLSGLQKEEEKVATKKEQVTWEVIKSTEYGFSIAFPTTPERKDSQGGYEDIPNLKYKETSWVSMPSLDKAFAVAVTTFSLPILKNTKEGLKLTQDEFVKEGDSKLIKSTFSQFHNLPALDYVIENKKDNYFQFDKAFIPNDKTVIIIRTISFSSNPPDGYDKFISSFKLLKSD